MSFDKHVSAVCRKSYFYIRSSLTTDAAKTVASSIVGSCLDYCNSLLAGTSVLNLSRLQLVQNTLARVVAQKPRYCHITPVLIDLHWLSVCQRIEFKIATTRVATSPRFLESKSSPSPACLEWSPSPSLTGQDSSPSPGGYESESDSESRCLWLESESKFQGAEISQL